MLNRYLEYNYVEKCRKYLQKDILRYLVRIECIRKFYNNILQNYKKNNSFPHLMWNSEYFQKKYRIDKNKISTIFLPYEIKIFNIEHNHRDCKNCIEYANKINCSCKKEKKKRKHQKLCGCITTELLELYIKFYNFALFIRNTENLNDIYQSKNIQNYNLIYHNKEDFLWHINNL